MTAETIQILIETLPPEVLALSKLGGRQTFSPEWGYNAAVQRFVSSYRDMDFGWQYCRLTAQHGLDFLSAPLLGDDEILWRAYLFCLNPKKYGSNDIHMALAVASNDMRISRSMLEGLLLVKGTTAHKAAKAAGLPVECVKAFERLFFNVLDRKDDTAYLQSILYPHGRLVELMENYMEHSGFQSLVRRAGFHNGAEDVLYLVGSSNSAVDAVSKAGSPKQLEGLMMAYGYMLARNGGLGQSGLQGIQNAKALMTAGKLGGEESDERPLSDDLVGTLREELRRYAAPVVTMMA